MNSQQPAALLDAVRRIWAHISANSPDIGDMFERITQSFYTKVIRSGDTVVDGGAHTGRHTIPLARLVGADGLVVAFEPLPSAAGALKQLLAGSGLGRHVRLRAEALAREAGMRRDFFVVNNMPEYSGLRRREYVGFVPDHTRVQVDVETIDSVLNMSQCPGSLSFVKLDLEGGEFRALQGAERTLRAHRPCCVFENTLESSADGYSAEEFFGYFEHIDYELYDILGCHVTETCWSQSGPWHFVTMPRTRSGTLLPLLWASALEELLTSRWSPKGQTGPPPASLASQDGPGEKGVMGYVDRVERSIRIGGWAVDLQAGQPARSLVITVDGTPLATAYPEKARHDVVAATGEVGFEWSGFDVVVHTTSGERVEVHAQAADGTFVKLASAYPAVSASHH